MYVKALVMLQVLEPGCFSAQHLMRDIVSAFVNHHRFRGSLSFISGAAASSWLVYAVRCSITHLQPTSDGCIVAQA